MLRHILLALAALAVQFAYAGEAGKVIFVAGSAQIVDRQAVLGQAVQEGELIKTGADGFVYIKTIDNGLFILRPKTEARISTYHVDSADPAKTQVKLELLSGVARAKSGDAVKAARQNFRFNTPVAAIGVRGTDFTVFTDRDETRVAVFSGGVVVSGFNATCTPDGAGPCEGGASKELFAAQRGKVLQVQRGKVTPVLIQASALSPDNIAPSRPDEPKGDHDVSATLNLDAQKTSSLRNVVTQNSTQPPSVNPPTTPITPPVIIPPVVVVPEGPPSGIVWGRWQPLVASPAKFNLLTEKAKAELVAVNGYYALLRTPGVEYVTPEKGNIAFSLQNSEAYIFTGVGAAQTVSQAAVLGGKLAVDFGARTFATNLDMSANAEKFTLRSSGSVSGDGRLLGDRAAGIGMMNVQGVLSNENNGSAAYIFDSRLDANRTVNGAAYWRK